MSNIPAAANPPLPKDGLALRSYLLVSQYIAPLMRHQLRRRLAAGKELHSRYTEKLGIATDARPSGTLVWLHGVGLGEVLALRGLISTMLSHRQDLSFLVTSSTRTSAEVFSQNTTDRTIHQFLPLDAQPFVKKFLDHWQPDISVWAEQDLWPAMVVETDSRDIPLALVNARMNQRAYKSRARLRRLYADLYKRFKTISAQDETTADHMQLLGASVSVGGSLKTAAVPLEDKVEKRAQFSAAIDGRKCWVVASSHSEDEKLATSAHRQLLKDNPQLLLIIAPRLIDRKEDIINDCNNQQLSVAARSDNKLPQQHHNVYLADTFGEMGIWYRVSIAAYIGGSTGPVQGHNPWEAAILDCPVIHGPNVANFSDDYTALQQHHAAMNVSTADQLAACIKEEQGLPEMSTNARRLILDKNSTIESIARKLLALLPDATTE